MVVLGSPIRMGGWLPEMLEFIRLNQTRLNQIPTAFFTVHMHNTRNDEKRWLLCMKPSLLAR